MTESESELLTRLAESGRREELPSVIARIGPRGAGIEAVEALHGILSRATARDLLWIESKRGELFEGWRSIGLPWYEVQASDVTRLAPPLVRLASFHPSGHIRQASVEALARDEGRDVLSYLLIRANDWVAPIAEQALALVRARVGPAHMAAWIAALPCVLHLRTTSRWDLTEYLDGVIATMRSPAARAALREAFFGADVETRRACVEIVSKLPSREAIPLLTESATTDPDMRVAASAGHALRRMAIAESVPSVLSSLVRHRAPDVRARALDALWRRAPEMAAAPSRTALFDPSNSVRTVAQFELARTGVDVSSLYRNAIHDARGASLATSLSGLSECGSPSDVSLPLAHVRDPSSLVRCEALRALTRLSKEPHGEVFLAALEDRSTRVVVAACQALVTRSHLLEPTTLLPILDRGGAKARAAYALSTRANRFTSIVAALRATRIPPLRHRAQARLWFWTHAKGLVVDDVALFRAELDAARSTLDPDLATHLDAVAAIAAAKA